MRKEYLPPALMPNSTISRATGIPPKHANTLARMAAVILILSSPLALAGLVYSDSAEATSQSALPIMDRNMDVSRARATDQPHSEEEQALFDGWPLYRTDTGQTAFNSAMATLRATESSAPGREAFANCPDLNCELVLPEIGSDGWIPAGRIWTSPDDYVLIVHSPRLSAGSKYRRRSSSSMRYFVYHEFHNSTRNTDPYDTISSHNRSVFVPLYMSKEGVDANGRHFVVIVQVAPHDVVSVHASNMGSRGPGIEVAKNYTDKLQPLQARAGILIGAIIKTAEPHLKVVNHRGIEGKPMLQAYENRLAALKAQSRVETVALPFVPASDQLVATASAELAELKSIGGTRAATQYAARTEPASELQVPVPRLIASANMPLTQFVELLRLIEPPRLLSQP